MPQQLKEVEITPHHRPTEWVKAGVWAFIAFTVIVIMFWLFIWKPTSIGAFWSDMMTGFIVSVIMVASLVAGVTVGVLIYEYKKAKVIDMGQFGTIVMKGKKTIELPPLSADTPTSPQPAVNLISPSEKAGEYLPYVKLASYLQSKGVDLQELEDCIDEQDEPKEPVQEFEQPHTRELTDVQKRVLNLWEQGKHGRLSIHKADPTISEHTASITLAELKGAGLIK